MSELLKQPERTQKSPEEKLAQAQRIARKLVTRALKVSDPSYDGIEATADSNSNGSKAAIVRSKTSGKYEKTIQMHVDDEGIQLTKDLEGPTRSHGGIFVRQGMEHEQATASTGHGYEMYGYESMQVKDLTPEQKDRVIAGLLMEIRGAIADAELEKKPDGDEYLDDLVNRILAS